MKNEDDSPALDEDLEVKGGLKKIVLGDNRNSLQPYQASLTSRG